MKKLNWLFLFLSAILYAIPYLCSDVLWWLIFIFPVPLLYITCTEDLSFIPGYIWGILVFSLHLNAGIIIVANLAGEWWWIGFLIGMGMVLYQAFVLAVLFWLITILARTFSIVSPITRIFVWSTALAVFILWTDRYCMWIFGIKEGYPFMHPLLPLSQHPLLLYALPILGKQTVLFVFFLVPISIVLVIWYKNYISLVMFIIAIAPWIWWGVHEPNPQEFPVWYKSICTLPCMIRAHTPQGALNILTQHIKKLIAAYPEVSIIIMPESALDIVDDGALSIANVTLLNRSKFFPALALNLLKGFFERSRIPFNKFRVSANNMNISSWLKGMCYIWHEYCKKKQLHVIYGGCCSQDATYYNALYWIHNGVVQARYDKKHAMLMTERFADWMNSDWLRKIYFKDDISITQSCKERKPLRLSESIAFIPYICSELFFNEYPDDCYPDVPILVIVNDTLLINSYMQKLLLLLAQFKAIQWQRDIVYVSYGDSVFIGQQGSVKQIN